MAPDQNNDHQAAGLLDLAPKTVRSHSFKSIRSSNLSFGIKKYSCSHPKVGRTHSTF